MARKIIRSDRVKIITGKHKGAVGVVGKVISQILANGKESVKVSIRGIDPIKKKVKSPRGGYEDKEIDVLFDISNVAHYDSTTKKHYRASFFIDEDGIKKRRMKKIDVVIGS